MADVNEIMALQASLRGTRQAAAQLEAVSARVDAADPHVEVAEGDLDELHRLALANAVAAQALRGLVETMLRRRGEVEEAVVMNTGGADE